MARLAYLGTPAMAVPPLRALVDAGHDVALCVTRPDRRRGRRAAATPSPVSQAAHSLGIRVTHDLADLEGAEVELGVVVAYGRIIPAAVLERVPMCNLHFSLLPRWRGAAPLERAILAGDRETGVCVMKVEEGLDTGPVYLRRTFGLDDEIDLASMRAALVEIGSELLVEALAHGVGAMPTPVPQIGAATTAAKLDHEDFHLDWDASARQLQRVVRLGRAWTTFRGKRLGVLKAAVEPEGGPPAPPGTLRGASVATADGSLVLLQVQPESRMAMSAQDWLRGIRPMQSERLGSG